MTRVTVQDGVEISLVNLSTKNSPQYGIKIKQSQRYVTKKKWQECDCRFALFLQGGYKAHSMWAVQTRQPGKKNSELTKK
jgi:hypothetical protein